jgi:hypothetical protein
MRYDPRMTSNLCGSKRALGRALALLSLLPVALGAGPCRAHAQGVDFGVSLVGTVGTLPVRVELTRRGDTLSGTYYYDLAKPGLRSALSQLQLSGRIDARGGFKLDESEVAEGGERSTGTFEGTLSTNGGVRAEGTWRSPGRKTLPFSLAERRLAVAGAAFMTMGGSELNRGVGYEVEAHYPALRDDTPAVRAFNSAAEAFANERVAAFKALVTTEERARDDDYEVHFGYELTPSIETATDRVVSVVFTEYVNSGGAYPNTDRPAFTFDVKAGKRVRLGDLFRPRTPFLTALSAAARRTLAGTPFAGSAAFDLEADDVESWYLTVKGLVVILDIPHALGDTVEVFVPFSEVKGLVDPSGPAGALAR